MSYQTELEKIEQPLTAELYTLLVGNTYYYYTSYETSIVYGGHTYLPRPLKRTGFSVEKSMKTVDVTISTPVVVAFSEYLAASPYSKTTVTITKVFVSSPDTLSKLIFTGMLYSVSVKNGIASTLFKSSNGLLARRVPRVMYQTNCNWALFSEQCGLDKDDYMYNAVVGSVSDNDLTLPLLINIPDKKYQGGILAFGAEQRLITNHAGTTVTVLVQFAGIAAGDAVKLYPGCNGSSGACASFGNQAHYMGMPHIPTRNALMWGFR
jgi:uncharacterized phage protein (TIGR02218 family)